VKSLNEFDTILDRSFFSRPTPVVARDLLGAILVCGGIEAQISETEAYLPTDDPAAHAAAGLTPRTRVIFGPPGHAYVYLNYGIHHMLNIVAEPEGIPGCVLIRGAGEWSGPGRLTRAMGINLSHYGADLTQGNFTIRKGQTIPDENVLITPRIGIPKASEKLLRFLIAPAADLGYNLSSYGRKREI
jgi:DNA-3-methyladenine glycosylase